MNRSQFLKAFRKSKDITVDGNEITINELTMAQRSKLMDLTHDKSVDNFRKQAVIVCMALDIFDENKEEDVDAVYGMGDSVLEIAEHVLNLSALGDESAEKNS